MATVDSLEPQRRAILELLLRQGKGYDDLARMLDMPGGRVREFAQEALVSLDPAAARRVEEDWRGQVADYVLGQQSGPEARATRGHLKRSQSARAWVSSLLDSLDELYEGARPDVPEPDGGRTARPSGGAARPSGRVAASAAGPDAAAGRAEGGAAPVDPGARETETEESPPAREPSAAGGPVGAAVRSPTPAPSRSTGRASGRPYWRAVPLPGAEAVRRRQVTWGAVAAAVVAAVVLAIALIGGGDEQDKAPSAAAGGQGAGAPEAQTRLVGQGELRSLGRGSAHGVAVIAERGGDPQLLVQARGLEPSGRRAAYEVWLYNSQRDAVSLGGQVADQSGNLQGAGPLPPEFRTYRFIDISRERIDRNAEHSGESVLRVPVAEVLRGARAAPGGGATP